MDEIERGAAMAARRNQLRMTQGHLAAAAGVSRSTVQRAEKGLPLSAENARSIDAVLGLEALPPLAPSTVDRPLPTGKGWRGLLTEISVSVVLALAAVLVLGPWLQNDLKAHGWAAPRVQSAAELLLSLVFGAILVTLPFAMLYDGRRIAAGIEQVPYASRTLSALAVTACGGLLFLTMIVPMLLAAP